MRSKLRKAAADGLEGFTWFGETRLTREGKTKDSNQDCDRSIRTSYCSKGIQPQFEEHPCSDEGHEPFGFGRCRQFGTRAGENSLLAPRYLAFEYAPRLGDDVEVLASD